MSILSPRSLRSYQTDGIAAVHKAWSDRKRPMVCVATGGGKTVMIAQLLVESVAPGQRAIVIAHTEEIVNQIHYTIQSQFGPDVGIVMGKQSDDDAQIIVATRQSLGKKRLRNILEYGQIHVVVIDEAHHATSTNTYSDIVDHLYESNDELNLVGFTATPSRVDQQGTDQDGDFFDEIVYSWTIADGIKGGFLVPAIQITGVAPPRTKCGMLSKHWLKHCVGVYEKYVAGRHPCLAFFPSILRSKQFTQELVRLGYRSAHIDGKTKKDERRAIIEAFKRGDIDVICNMEVLTEGFDAPNASSILIARPTRSLSLFTQILGRGLRPYPGKEYCLVINLVHDDETFMISEID